MNIYFKIFLFVSFASFAQPGKMLTIAEKMPEFPGGTDELVRFIVAHLQMPAMVREAGGSGKAYVNFIVDTSGNVTEPKIVKSSGYKEMDIEVLRLVKSMPKWSPAIDSSVKVKVSMNIPISFKNSTNIEGDSGPKLSPEEQGKQDQAMTYYYEARKLEYESKYTTALEKLALSLAIEPNNKYALFDNGKVLMVLGEKEKACANWNKMIQDNIRKGEAQEFINKYCVGENGPQEMVKYYNKIKAIDFFEEGLKIVNSGRYEAALRKFDTCLKYNSEHKDALFNKGLMHFKLDQKNAACVSWKKLLTISPEDKQTENLIKKNCN